MTFTEPIPFHEAIRYLVGKTIFPTTLDTEGLRKIAAGIRERSFFSATNAIESVLDRMKALLEEALAPQRVKREDRITPDNPEGWVNVGKDVPTMRLEIKKALMAVKYEPDPEIRGTLKDLSSDERINLVVRTNRDLAYGFGMKLQGQTPGALDAFPAWELYRLEDREVPRGYRKKGGMLVPDPGESWPERFREAGEATGREEGDGWIIKGQRMIALKNHPIWDELGSSKLFDDALDVSYPPFAFNSGMWVEDIDADEAIALGILQENQIVQPDPNLDFSLPAKLLEAVV